MELTSSGNDLRAPEHDSDLAAAIGTNTPPPPNPHLNGLETGCPDRQAKTPGMMLRAEEAAKVCFKGAGGRCVGRGAANGSTRFINGG